MTDTNSLSHSKWNCKYHIVFAPKYRRQAIYSKIKADIGQILRKLCEIEKVEILEVNACPDHIHMLLKIPPNISVAQFMWYLKGKSSPMIFDRHANLKYKYGNRHFLCRGYYVVNSFLGRLHWASCVNLLNEKKFALVQEGVKLSSTISEFKKACYPVFPNWLSRYGDEFVVSGLQNGNKIYLAVWNIGKRGKKRFELDKVVKSVKCAYPQSNEVNITFNKNEITVDFTKDIQARFLEVII